MGRSLRVALLSYRSKPHGGGQGVYVRALSRELRELGHRVEVLSGQPFPELDDGVPLTRVPSLDLYREPDPFRTPRPSEFRDRIDVLEYATMCTAGFPEPPTFSLRAARLLLLQAPLFDLVHDNQSLASGRLPPGRPGLPPGDPVPPTLAVGRGRRPAGAPWVGRARPLPRLSGFARIRAGGAPQRAGVTASSAISPRDIKTHLGCPADA